MTMQCCARHEYVSCHLTKPDVPCCLVQKRWPVCLSLTVRTSGLTKVFEKECFFHGKGALPLVLPAEMGCFKSARFTILGH